MNEPTVKSICYFCSVWIDSYCYFHLSKLHIHCTYNRGNEYVVFRIPIAYFVFLFLISYSYLLFRISILIIPWISKWNGKAIVPGC